MLPSPQPRNRPKRSETAGNIADRTRLARNESGGILRNAVILPLDLWQ